jgi:hypothetical protein
VHEGVETLVGLFLPLVGEVEIDHGGFELGGPQGALNKSGLHAGFEQMGSVGMAARISTLHILRRSPRSVLRILPSLGKP